MKRNFFNILKIIPGLIGVAFFMQAARQLPEKGWVDTERLLTADSEPGNWYFSGRDFQEQHFSPLSQINESNVKTLGYVWEYDASPRRGSVQRGLEATPSVVDGIMYTTGAWGVVYALDARNGKELWRYDPEVDGSFARKAGCDVVNRGLQLWEGRVYVGTLDAGTAALSKAKRDCFVRL